MLVRYALHVHVRQPLLVCALLQHSLRSHAFHIRVQDLGYVWLRVLCSDRLC